MRASYAATMGTDCPADPGDLKTVRSFAGTIGSRFSSFDELVSPAGLVELAGAAVSSGVDAGRLLASHYPNTYIAWLDALR